MMSTSSMRTAAFLILFIGFQIAFIRKFNYAYFHHQPLDSDVKNKNKYTHLDNVIGVAEREEVKANDQMTVSVPEERLPRIQSPTSSPTSPPIQEEENQSASNKHNNFVPSNTQQQQHHNDTTTYDPSQTQNLIQFVIGGFPKTSTGFLRNHYLNVPQTFWGERDLKEMHALREGQEGLEQIVRDFKEHVNVTIPLVRTVFSHTNDNHSSDSINADKVEQEKMMLKVINGYKNPSVLYDQKRELLPLIKYFPNTKLIISVRHPILWFESFYNFRNRKQHNLKKPAETLIGDCHKDCKEKHCLFSKGVCTGSARFHHFLSLLRFTPMTSENEINLLRRQRYENEEGVGYRTMTPSVSNVTDPFPNEVFLMEIGQVADKNQTRTDQLSRDFEQFLGLEPYMLDFENAVEAHRGKESIIDSKTFTYDWKIDICDDRYQHLRKTLLVIGRDASEWIRDYFLKSSNVIVSSRDYLVELLEKWKVDPCLVDH